jgi:hypothetical protein
MRHKNSLMYIEATTTALAINDSAFKVRSPGLAGSCHSFESRNFPGFFIRHQNSRLKLGKFEDRELFRKDATFCIRPGLADPQRGSSFESFNFPGRFIRQKNFELYIQRDDGTALFKKDGTYYQRRAGTPIDDN